MTKFKYVDVKVMRELASIKLCKCVRVQVCKYVGMYSNDTPTNIKNGYKFLPVIISKDNLNHYS